MRKASIDIPLAIVIFCLMIVGIIMISSVSVYESYQITSAMVAQGLRDEPSNSFLLLEALPACPCFNPSVDCSHLFST